MKLVIGGYAQGKLNYAMQKYHIAENLVWDKELPENSNGHGKTVIINHFHSWVKLRMEQGGNPQGEILRFIAENPDCVIISDEVGNGIVPVDAFEREYREQTGRILVQLAREAEEVERVICGIAQKIK